MYANPVFKEVACIDKSRIEYQNFSNALLSVDWQPSPVIRESHASLEYAPGFIFNDVPWSNTHPGFINRWGTDNSPTTPEIKNVKAQSIKFFEYLEELIPNHRIVKAEMMATQPEVQDRRSELRRMHFDNRVYHKHAKRCQLAFLTNPGSFLFVEHQSLNLTTDVVYEFNNRLCHWGVNWGNTLKLVLVFDAIDIDAWNKLSPTIKSNFYEEEKLTIDLFQSKKFINEFIHIHKLAPRPGIEPGSTL